MTTRSSCGRWPVAAKCAPSQATPTMSIPWRSAPTGGCWHQAPMTTRSSCGKWPVAAKCAPSTAKPTGSGPWRSVPTASSWHQAPAANAADSAIAQGEIKLWDVASGREVRTLSGHTDWVWSVAFSPDGRLLASGSWDTTIKLWEVASGSLVRSLTGHPGFGVNSVAFSPTGGSWHQAPAAQPTASAHSRRDQAVGCGQWQGSAHPLRPRQLGLVRGIQPRRAAPGLRLLGQDDQAVGHQRSGGEVRPHPNPLRKRRGNLTPTLSACGEGQGEVNYQRTSTRTSSIKYSNTVSQATLIPSATHSSPSVEATGIVN
jgi:hypothetical protein